MILLLLLPISKSLLGVLISVPSRLPSPSLFGVGRIPCLFPIFFWTKVPLEEWEPTKFDDETEMLFGSPRLPSLLNLACLFLKAFKVACPYRVLDPP